MSRRIVVMPQNNGKKNNRSRVQPPEQPQANTQHSNATWKATVSTSPSVDQAVTETSNGSTSIDSNNGSLHVQVRQHDTVIPIEDASVTLSYPGSDGGLISERNTDRNGEVLIENVTPTSMMEPPNMNYSIQVEKPGFHKELVENIQIVPEETTERLVELQPTQDGRNRNRSTNNQNGVPSGVPRRITTGKLRVQVKDAKSMQPIEDASIRIQKVGDEELVIRQARTDASGNTPKIELAANNIPGSNAFYQIIVEAPGYMGAKISRIEIEPNETVIENIYLSPAMENDATLYTMETPSPNDQSDIASNINAGNPEDVEVNTEVSEPLPNPNLMEGAGRLRANVVSVLQSRPISSATVRIYYSGDRETPIEELTTDNIGRTPIVELAAPNIQYSLTPSVEQPYANYDILVEVPGFESLEVNNIEILADTLAILNVSLMPLPDAQGESAELYVIPPHTLYGDYPPKIAEAEIKPLGQSGEIVLSKVVIPEYVVVHDGPPSDKSAANYYVKYKDYIKNVASSEIYATWPEATIMANVLCIQSFVLNRVYTEWYRNRGYQFTITNSTAYDQKFIAERNIFDSISKVVDQVFANYITRPNIEQPLFTQFCDGLRVSCPNWLSQWGSKYLGDQGYSAIDILRNYYGNDIYIATAEEVSGVPASWPGVELQVGSRGDSVRQIQRMLNGISKGYPLIGKVAQDGVYGQKTADAVKTFQEIFDLPQTGVVDFPTWYKISEVYVGVTRIAELN